MTINSFGLDIYQSEGFRTFEENGVTRVNYNPNIIN